jgi:hypothetical protein
MRHRPQHRSFDPLRLRLMSAGGWVVLGDGSEVEQSLERQSDGALPAGPGEPFGNAIPRRDAHSRRTHFRIRPCG